MRTLNLVENSQGSYSFKGSSEHLSASLGTVRSSEIVSWVRNSAEKWMPLLVCTFRLLRDRTPVTMARTFLSLDFLSKLFKASTRNFESYVISESDCLRSHRLSVVIHLIPIRRIVYDLIPSHSFPIASLSDSPYSILFVRFSLSHSLDSTGS